MGLKTVRLIYQEAFVLLNNLSTYMFSKLVSNIKIALILVIGLGLSSLAIYCFFPSNTPQINLSNFKYIAQVVNEKQKVLLAFFTRKGQGIVDTTDLSTFTHISKGIYAKEEQGKRITVVKQDEMDMVQYTVVVDNKPLTVRVPADSVKKEDLEKMLNEMKTYKPAN